MTVASLWNYVRLKKMSNREIVSDYYLRLHPAALSWRGFAVPAILLIAGLIGDISIFIVSLAAASSIIVLLDWALTRRFVYDYYLISGNNLIRNGFNIKEFDLQELTMVDFSPFSDSLKLTFKNGKSIQIPRQYFNSTNLIIFIKMAIERSCLDVVIPDDARSKIYVEDVGC